MQRALDSAIGLPRRSTSALSMVVLVMPAEVRRNLNGYSFARGVGGASLRETHQRRTNHRSPEPSGDSPERWRRLKALIADSGAGVRDLVGVILRERCAVVTTLEQA